MCGDMNAKIGEGNPIGKHALGTMNDTGARLVNFARANAFVAANCLVRRHPRRLYTWKSFDLTCRNQIDYFLVQERWKSSICNFVSYIVHKRSISAVCDMIIVQQSRDIDMTSLCHCNVPRYLSLPALHVYDDVVLIT